jgi:hypothetical protein
MRIPLLFALSLPFALFPLAGCSSDSATPGGGPSDYAPEGNGVAMNEGDACQAISGALSQHKLALGCGPSTLPACPGLISQGHPACSSYDQGTVSACVGYYNQLSCDELKVKHCIVKVIENSAPNGCPVLDAGNDAPEDATEDVTEDVVDDGASDAGSDADLDAANDASDAAAD